MPENALASLAYNGSRGITTRGRTPIAVTNTESLKQRTVEVFPAGYTTLLSIVQGIAFGFLATGEVVATLGGHGPPTEFGIAATAGTFLAIVTVTYMYVWFTLVLRWVPSILDTLIPFSLGSLEIVMAVTVNSPEVWFLSVTGMQVVGLLAFAHSALRCRNSMFEREEDFRRVKSLLNLLVTVSALGAVLSVGTAILMIEFPVVRIVAVLLAWLLPALAAIALVWSSERALSRLYSSHGLVRWLN